MEDKSEVKVYEWREHIRMRPGMYIGGIGNRGVLALVKGLTEEIISHSRRPVSIAYALLDNYNITLTIAGLELDTIHSSFVEIDNLRDNLFSVATTALCSIFVVTYKGKRQQLEKGVFTGYKDCDYSDDIDVGINFDESIFHDLDIDYYLMCQMLYYMAVLNPTAEIKVIDRRDKANDTLRLNFPEGIKSHFRRLCTMALSEAKYEVIIDRAIRDNQCVICIGWGDWRYEDVWHETYCNNEYLKWGGSLIDGIKAGLVSVGKKHNKKGARTNSKFKAITIIASLKTPDPKWAGSTKWAIDMPEVEKEVKGIIIEEVQKYIDENPENGGKLLSNMCLY